MDTRVGCVQQSWVQNGRECRLDRKINQLEEMDPRVGCVSIARSKTYCCSVRVVSHSSMILLPPADFERVWLRVSRSWSGKRAVIHKFENFSESEDAYEAVNRMDTGYNHRNNPPFERKRLSPVASGYWTFRHVVALAEVHTVNKFKALTGARLLVSND